VRKSADFKQAPKWGGNREFIACRDLTHRAERDRKALDPDAPVNLLFRILARCTVILLLSIGAAALDEGFRVAAAIVRMVDVVLLL